MAQKDIQLKIDTVVESADAAKSLGALRRNLLEIQQLQAQIGDESSEEFKKLQSAANATTAKMASVRDSVGDIGDKIRTLEGTPVERLRGSFDLLQEGIMNLDFDKLKTGLSGFTTLATEQFSNLQESFKGLIGRAGELFKQFAAAPLATLASGFTAITTAIAAATKSVIANTIALLTNPLFLLGAVIAVVVVGLIALANKFGLLTVVVEKMTAALRFVVGLLEQLTDWLGFTSNASDREAARIEANEKAKRAAFQLTVESSNKLRDITIQNMEEGEAKRKAILKAQMDDAKMKLKIDEENAKAEALQKLGFTVAGLKQVAQIEDTYNKIREQMNIGYQKSITKIEKEAAEERAKDRKSRLDEERSQAEKGLNDLIKLNQNNLSKEKEGSLSALEVFKKGKADELEYVKKHYEKLGINLKDYEAEYNRVINQEVENYNKSQEKKRLANEVVLKEIAVLEANATTDKEAQLTAQNELVRAKLAEQLSDENLTIEERKLLTLQAEQEIQNNINGVRDEAKEKDKERLAELQALRDEYNITQEENEIARLERELERENLTKDEKLRLMQELSDAKIRLLQEEERQALTSLDAEYQQRIKLAKTPEEAALIDQWYAGERLRITSETAESEKQIQSETTEKINADQDRRLQKVLDIAKQSLNAASSLANTVFSLQETFGKKGTESEKKRAKQQFEVRKALSIGGAVVSTIEGVVNALTAKTLIPEPFGSILKGVNAAAVGAAGLANIAKIASSKFESPAAPSPDTGGDMGGGGVPSTATPQAPQVPQFTPAQFFNVGQQQGGGGQTPPIQVVVTETDITDTQTRVRVIEDRATIG